jgi:hypothetical protein
LTSTSALFPSETNCDEAHAVGADHPHPGAAHALQDAALDLCARRSGFAKAGSDHHHALHADLKTLFDAGLHRIPRHHHHGEVERLGDRP